MQELKWYEILIGIIFIVGIVGTFIGACVIESLIDFIKQNKKNRQWRKQNPGKIKKLCIHCKYCKWTYYHPFSKSGPYRNVAVSKEPRYCTYLKQHLSGSGSRCQIKDFERAFWEEK